jgi:hypothetical protein
MRRILRPSFSALLCAAFFAQSVGAADLGPVFARGMMLPPPGRMMPMPLPSRIAPAKPAGQPWLVSAKIVAAWVAERVEESLRPAPAESEPSAAALAALASIARAENAVASAAQAPEPPTDRMLIAMEGRRLLAAGIASQLSALLQFRTELKPIRERFTGDWVGSGAARARVDYLAPVGMTRGEAKGFRVTLSDGYRRLLPNRGAIPAQLMRELPLYFAGDSVDVEVTVVNTGEEALNDLTLVSVQEDFVASGAAGAPTGSPATKSIASLAPGASAVVRWRMKLSSEAREAVNFEQTHLRVLGKDPAGGEKVLLDQTQAGLIDPPGL